MGINAIGSFYTQNYDPKNKINSTKSKSSIPEFTSNSISDKVNTQSSHVVYIKKEDMLYSGGNGTGLSFYLKYAENSTEDTPLILAKGIDEFGKEFEQIIDVKKVNPRNATLPEMRALEAYSGVDKRYGFSSLPMGSENVGLNQRQDFIAAFKKNISDMNFLGMSGLAEQYSNLLGYYEQYDWLGNVENKAEHSNFNKSIPKIFNRIV